MDTRHAYDIDCSQNKLTPTIAVCKNNRTFLSFLSRFPSLKVRNIAVLHQTQRSEQGEVTHVVLADIINSNVAVRDRRPCREIGAKIGQFTRKYRENCTD